MENNTIITGIISPLIALIPTLYLAWKTWEKKQSNLALRIIRKEREIAKAELDKKRAIEQNKQELQIIETDGEVRLAKLKIELASLKEEANYLNRMSKFESGELNETGKTEKLFADLKAKGEGMVKKGTEQVKQSLGEIDKGLSKVKGISDQFKDLKDKIPNPLKKE